MPRKLRFIPEEGALVEITCRTLQSRLLITPNHESNELIAGILGRAQRIYRMRICAFVFMSNHFHLLLDVDDAQQLALFMGYVSSNVAKEIGRLVDWKEKFWARRYQSILVSDEEQAQVSRLRYILLHGFKENLVDRPENWPGLQCHAALKTGRHIMGMWFNRTKEYNARRRGKKVGYYEFATEESIELSPLPCWQALTEKERKAALENLLMEIEILVRAAERPSFDGSRLLNQDPHMRARDSKKTAAPSFHAASRSAFSRLREAYNQFVEAFREASARLLAGIREVIFPTGSFPPALPYVRKSPGCYGFPGPSKALLTR